ncbi:GNAT family N-acetyltransferase [Leucobacter japonicus]|uniref:GNAT family N-acetyltransferase n=1 Tax=Leucobacter japonicus TaxID=1461259 RepID=UPI0006A7605A|nr:GNAT family N-acetyltransferase [Leucobacter japonicus]
MIAELELPIDLTDVAPGLRLRRASRADLDALIALLAEDPISASRGDTGDASDRPAYAAALDAIIRNDANELIVVVGADDYPIGTLQLTRIPGMARQGASRLLVEAVRVAAHARSRGIGSALMRWVMHTAAPELHTPMVQLTSDAARESAHRFYLRLGFTDSHVGFKYYASAAR